MTIVSVRLVLAAFLLLVQMAPYGSSGTFKWDSFCHQQAEYPDLVAMLTSSPDDAIEWCVIIPDNGKYLDNVTNKLHDNKYPYVLDMLKVRQLCRIFNATLIDIDFKENTTKSLAVKRVLVELERRREDKTIQVSYPVDCTYEYNATMNKTFVACAKGCLPDDYEYYFAYVNKLYLHPFVRIQRMKNRGAEFMKSTYYYVCYQKVNKTESTNGRGSAITEAWFLLVLFSYSLI